MPFFSGSKCTVNYTMGMSGTNCILGQETPHASGWKKSDVSAFIRVCVSEREREREREKRVQMSSQL